MIGYFVKTKHTQKIIKSQKDIIRIGVRDPNFMQNNNQQVNRIVSADPPQKEIIRDAVVAGRVPHRENPTQQTIDKKFGMLVIGHGIGGERQLAEEKSAKGKDPK